ncbi:uncharacterized protein LOC105703287 [Orussus abietinus]|uniref:uncharacterized protein LOC105703287 n=1 Tax=Orussus abietinus TaxID=222816 RepID=UPI0006264D41|nr:uncharacterized protein LOC105703287 [Orussus abietinus]XP_012286995.1 uncharacterized protein LOC105703287 [Orussus abietinus]XP_012286996.1 uncharacterized protein LOC105703287 [Orussus abietinus]XP_012286997.1 uncharacterized protein LOC105703287 [Orussus abietinus]XP_012286998.1 uncharacterized protein LOC105703287 [Orussus abietinus]
MPMTAGANKWASRAVVVLQLAAWSAVGIVLLQKGVTSLQKVDMKNYTQVQIVSGSKVAFGMPEADLETTVPNELSVIPLQEESKNTPNNGNPPPNSEKVIWKNDVPNEGVGTESHSWAVEFAEKSLKSLQESRDSRMLQIEDKMFKTEPRIVNDEGKGEKNEDPKMETDFSNDYEKSSKNRNLNSEVDVLRESKRMNLEEVYGPKSIPKMRINEEIQETTEGSFKENPERKTSQEIRPINITELLNSLQDNSASRNAGSKFNSAGIKDNALTPDQMPWRRDRLRIYAAEVEEQRNVTTESAPVLDTRRRETTWEHRRKHRLSHLTGGGAAAAVAMVAVGAVMLILGPAVIILRALDERRQERRFLKLSGQDDPPPTYEQATLMDEAPRYSTLSLNTILGPPPPPSPGPTPPRAQLV